MAGWRVGGRYGWVSWRVRRDLTVRLLVRVSKSLLLLWVLAIPQPHAFADSMCSFQVASTLPRSDAWIGVVGG